MLELSNPTQIPFILFSINKTPSSLIEVGILGKYELWFGGGGVSEDECPNVALLLSKTNYFSESVIITASWPISNKFDNKHNLMVIAWIQTLDPTNIEQTLCIS